MLLYLWTEWSAYWVIQQLPTLQQSLNILYHHFLNEFNLSAGWLYLT